MAARFKCVGCTARTAGPRRRFCDYCDNRYSADDLTVEHCPRQGPNMAARARMAVMDRLTRPRVTRDSIELAKPHPWECDESAP